MVEWRIVIRPRIQVIPFISIRIIPNNFKPLGIIKRISIKKILVRLSSSLLSDWWHLRLADSILITVEEEKASILENFYQQNPFADFSQMDEIQQRTQLDEQIIRVSSLRLQNLLFISFC